ncbi:hypothetical protein BDN70DRAFT_878852 [Pholiota conissans]|uniref:Uncharacterized protein n=1 Tax=Pholiota conissans TaxID=109636 RepID=A0A9P5Z278_9AGAR|nr:hypothetical protein BDN70DRAFT_878852 [Pholiota conissans]
MIGISRTTVPESWLASPQSLKATKPHGTQQMITSRISISTINTDLFPELVSWATIIDSHSHRSSSQKIPIDVVAKREPDVETVLEVPESISLILDPTSLEFGFDQSFLEGFDDLLAYSPTEAFEEMCWAEATYHVSDRISTQPHPQKTGGHRRQTRSPLAANTSSESDTDSDDSLTFKEEDVHLDILNTGSFSDNHLVGNCMTYEKEDVYDDERTSFIYFESTFAMPNPKESVGFFPIPNIPRKSVPNRIAAFCSSLPGNLAFVRSPNAS